MYKFRFSYLALCAAVAACALTAGRFAFSLFGALDAPAVSGAFILSFLNGFFPVLLPMVLMCTLSVTVYCVPAALAFLCYRAFCDGYYICTLAGADGMSTALTAFLICTRAFYTYGYLLLAVGCMSYRAGAISLGYAHHPFTHRDSFRFFGDFTSVAGTVCLCGLFSFTVTYFL
ncbi:MAG: hypothetical protein IJ519_00075 [Clostridia bacterium]|nr:hypothetical protein [Clostridia bacterium]